MSGTSSFTHSVDDFDEDKVVSLGYYFYSRSSKVVLRKGNKRSRDHDDVSILITNQIIWTQQSGDPQIDAVDSSTILGAFTSANLDAVLTLNKEFEKRKEEMKRLEEELDEVKREHKNHVENLEKASEDKFKELYLKNSSLQDELQDEKTTNSTNIQRIALLVKQCEDGTASAASSTFFSFSQ